MKASEKNKILFLLTNSYPFGFGEEHLEDEIEYLSRAFTKIYIVSVTDQKLQTRKVPANAIVLPLAPVRNFRKRSGLLSTTFLDVLKEIKNMRRLYGLKVSKRLLKIAFGSYLRALHISKFISKNEAFKSQANVFMYAYWNDTLALSVALLKRLNPGTAAFCRAHRFDVYADQQELNYLPFTFLKFKLLDAIFFVSEDGKEFTLKRFPFINEHKTQTSRLGVKPYTETFQGRNENKIALLSISYFTKVKRVSLIAESLALITDINIEWFHIGEGSDHTESQNIQKLLVDHGNIKYQLLGNRLRSEVISFLQNQYVDLLINVSTSEGLPVSMMEAMSFSIPVLATNVGGVSEIVTDEYNGFLLAPNSNASEIATRIKKYAHLSFEERDRMKSNAFLTWKERFNADINFPRFLDKVFALSE